jgi:hypothetical protein
MKNFLKSSLNISIAPVLGKAIDYSASPKYTLLKAENKLSKKQKEKLEQVKDASPMLGIMHTFIKIRISRVV